MSVLIHSSLDKPFGKLANDALLPFMVDSHKYSSVVNFVYANLLPNSTFKEELAQTFPGNVLKTFNEVREHLKQSIMQSSIVIAIKEKAKQNKQFHQRLMDTENLNIIYYSPNIFLGIGRSKDGQNIYGQLLEQVRNELRSEQTKVQDKDNIYLSYIAEINLKKALRKHNLEKYISKDKKRSIRKLVDILVQDYGNTEVFLNSPDIDTILTLHEKRNIMVYTDPNSLIRVVRKNEVRNVLKRNTFDLKVAAFNTFVDYTISKNVTMSEDRTALKDQIFDILPAKREEFANRILDLYSVKALPGEVEDKIKKFKETWYFPSEKDIDYFLSESIKLPEIISESTITPGVHPVYIENDVLSPLDESSFIVVNRKFKSISHFVAFELHKLYGHLDPSKLYIRIKDVRGPDLDQFNKILEEDIFTSAKNKLLEDAINLKLQDWSIKNLVFSIDKLEFMDEYNLDKTEEFYNKYKDNIVLKIQKIPSFDRFVEKDIFLFDIIKDKVDFYFIILDNLMVHLKAKNKLSVSYDDLVEMSPFYSFIMINDSNVPYAKIPDYLLRKNIQYGLSNQSLLQIWSIIFNGMKLAEKIIGSNNYDIRYKSLLIWSKYLLGKPNYDMSRIDVMQNQEEDHILVVLLAILSKLKEVNLRFNSPTINKQDLQTAVHLCLGKVRSYKMEMVEQTLEFAEEIYDDDVEVYDEDNEEYYDFMDEDDDNFEGFSLGARKRFEAFLETYFNPLRNELKLTDVEEAVSKIIRSKIPAALKHQNLNFFGYGFKLPLL